jgi:predicted DNA-binding ribbon-helix-helix protein
LKKRSVRIAGHATSISLEEEFWDALKAIAEREKTSVPLLISKIDESRGGHNLSSAIRVFILKQVKET